MAEKSNLIYQDLDSSFLRDCFYLQSRPSCIFGQRIWAEDVESVYVRLGERPWLTREIGIRWGKMSRFTIDVKEI